MRKAFLRKQADNRFSNTWGESFIGIDWKDFFHHPISLATEKIKSSVYNHFIKRNYHPDGKP